MHSSRGTSSASDVWQRGADGGSGEGGGGEGGGEGDGGGGEGGEGGGEGGHGPGGGGGRGGGEGGGLGAWHHLHFLHLHFGQWCFFSLRSHHRSHAGAAHLYATQKPHALHLQSLQWWCANSCRQNVWQLAFSQ